MDLKEFIKLLKQLQKVHPEVKVVEARTVKGKKSNGVRVGLKGGVVLIEGER